MDAIGETVEAAAVRRVGSADAVVLDRERERAVVAADPDRGLGRVRVLADVRECLADNEVGGGLELAGERPGRAGDRDRDR